MVGRHFAFDQLQGDHQIVGVVDDVIEDGARTGATPHVYACQPAGEWRDPDYVVRYVGDVRLAIRGRPRRRAPRRTGACRVRSPAAR